MNVFTSNAKVVLYFFTYASLKYIFKIQCYNIIAIKVIHNTCIVMK